MLMEIVNNEKNKLKNLLEYVKIEDQIRDYLNKNVIIGDDIDKNGIYGFYDDNGYYYIGNTKQRLYDRINGFTVNLNKVIGLTSQRGHLWEITQLIKLISQGNLQYRITFNGKYKQYVWNWGHWVWNGSSTEYNWDGMINFYKINKLLEKIINGEKIKVRIIEEAPEYADNKWFTDNEKKYIKQFNTSCNMERHPDYHQRIFSQDDILIQIILKLTYHYPDLILYPTKKCQYQLDVNKKLKPEFGGCYKKNN